MSILQLPSRLVLASRNLGKLREVKALLGTPSIDWLTLNDFPEIQITEDGATMRDNAMLKATTVAKATGLWAVADDSGLEVDFLNGEPGVHSSRFLGEDATDEEKNREILHRLDGVSDEERTARFRCVIAVASPKRVERVAEATWEGRIADAALGRNGFGYDPIFYIPELRRTSAELPSEQKNILSHRGQALRLMFADALGI